MDFFFLPKNTQIIKTSINVVQIKFPEIEKKKKPTNPWMVESVQSH